MLQFYDEATLWNVFALMRSVAIFLLSASIGATVIFLVLSAVPLVAYWRKTRCSDGQLAHPFILGFTGNICWLSYGYYARDFGMIALNIFCITMSTFYVSNMYYYRSRKRNLTLILTVWLAVFCIVMTYVRTLETSESRAAFWGWVLTSFHSCGALGLVYVISKVIRLWRIDFMPFFPVLMGFILESQVFSYGVIMLDRYIMMANGFFMAMNGVLVSLFYLLPSNRQLQLPTFFTLFYDYAKGAYAEHISRKLQKKASSEVEVYDVNANIVEV